MTGKGGGELGLEGVIGGVWVGLILDRVDLAGNVTSGTVGEHIKFVEFKSVVIQVKLYILLAFSSCC